MDILFTQNKIVLLVVLVWVMFWKGSALWFAAKDNKKAWFWILLLVNLFGILEIIYIFNISKRTWGELKSLFMRDVAKAEENKQ